MRSRSEDCFQKLPRKELQRLCKQFGLPARNTTSQLAQSLRPYFQQAVEFNGCQKSITGKERITSQVHSLDMSTCLPGKAFASLNATRKAPCFEFYVTSQEGIRLSVDFNSSPSDWVNACRNQVLLCEIGSGSNSRSLSRMLGHIGESSKKTRTLFKDGTGETKNDHFQAANSPCLVPDKCTQPGAIGHEDSQCLITSEIVSCDADIDVPGFIMKDQRRISSKPCSDLHDKICTKHELRASMDPVITYSILEKTACNFAVISSMERAVDTTALEHHNSKKDNEVSENTITNGNCFLENNGKFYGAKEAGNYCNGASCLSHRNDESLKTMDSKNNLGNDHITLVNKRQRVPCSNLILACSGEQEVSVSGNGKESSICSVVTTQKTCSESDNMNCKEKSHEKRAAVDVEDRNECCKYGGKHLRIMKRSAGETSLRRSMRLQPK